LGAKQVVQGNLDNTLLAHGTLEEIEYATRRCVEEGERYGHIFNLSHGVLPSTPLEHVLHVIGIVKSYAAV
jgi:uroporphyrinogen decarboxylase